LENRERERERERIITKEVANQHNKKESNHAVQNSSSLGRAKMYSGYR
jgi:hypothetical protein